MTEQGKNNNESQVDTVQVELTELATDLEHVAGDKHRHNESRSDEAAPWRAGPRRPGGLEMTESFLETELQASILKAIATPSTIYKGDTILTVDSEGIQLHTTDAAKTAWNDISLPAAAFDKYHAESYRTAIDFNKVTSFLRVVDDAQQVEFNIGTINNIPRLGIHTNSLSRRFGLLDPDTCHEVLDPDNEKRPARVVVPGDLLDGPIYLADTAASAIAFGVEPSHNIFYGTADDTFGPNALRFAYTDAKFHEMDAAHVETTFSLDYLADVQNIIPGDATVTYELGTNCSTRIHYPIADGGGTVEFIVAYRIASSNSNEPKTWAQLQQTHPIDNQDPPKPSLSTSITSESKDSRSSITS